MWFAGRCGVFQRLFCFLLPLVAVRKMLAPVVTVYLTDHFFFFGVIKVHQLLMYVGLFMIIINNKFALITGKEEIGYGLAHKQLEAEVTQP